MANVQWFFRGLTDSVTGFHQLKTSTSSPADSDSPTLTTSALSAGQSESIKMVQQTGDNGSNFVESGITSLAFSVTKSGFGDGSTADTVVFELGYIVGTTETYFSEVINTGGGLQGLAGLYTFPATNYSVNEHAFPSGGRLIVKATFTTGSGQGTWTYLLHVNSSNYWTVPMHTVSSSTTSADITLSMDVVGASTVNITTLGSETMAAVVTAAGSGTGLNRIWFCDMSREKPEWSAWGSRFSANCIGILEDYNRVKMLAIGTDGLMKKLLNIGQVPFVWGTGVYGRDYWGAALNLDAYSRCMFGNDSDQTWKCFSHFIVGLDGKQANTLVRIFIDGDQTNYLTVPLIDRGNGFYWGWILKYGRRIEYRFDFDSTDAPQSERQMTMYYEPIGDVSYLNQTLL